MQNALMDFECRRIKTRAEN